METVAQNVLSTYVTIWLTLISGVIILKNAQEAYASVSSRMTPVRNALARVGTWLDKRPHWTDYFAFIPVTLLLLALPVVNVQILVKGGLALETLVIAQVSIAMGMVVGKMIVRLTVLTNKRSRHRPFQPVAFALSTAVALLMLYGVYVFTDKYLTYLISS